MPNILVVEDTADTAAVMKSVLELSGFDVVLAVDGLDGIEKAQAESPDLIITDISMPRLNGLEMIRELRRLPEFKTTPILAITSYGMNRAMEGIRAGANRAVARPIQNHLLLAFVIDLLEKRPRPLGEDFLLT
jgi:two-component system chemotaxis response regulator CheY